MSAEAKLTRRNIITIVLIVLTVPVIYLGMKGTKPEQDSQTRPLHVENKPGADAESAFLDGLKVGDELMGFRVAFVGAPREDGLMPIEFEQNGNFAMIVVGLITTDPLPPATTSKYAVYFERVHDKPQAKPEQASRLTEAVAARIRKVEETQPAPSGLKAPRKSGNPT
jgi:hypothetical protein